ncbi:MAG TPA: CBS domain-containing protein [Pyrinomonadaceae bacterium]|jgi:CBS domain-containing protein|nr:CBS domain-containing protein [Pyrinomonadaceae bacterium]
MMTIGDVISEREPYFVRESATALEAAKFMTNLNIGAVCVLDDEGRLRGIFSERALLRRVVVAGRDAATTRVGEMMSAIKAVVECKSTPHEALELMEKHGTRYLPVVRDDRWVGMLSMRDIMRVELSEQGDELRLLHEYIQH